MDKATVTLKTITYAQKTKKLLQKDNIDARIVKLSGDPLSGCTYGVEFDRKYYYKVIALLRENEISYGTVK